jgi:hypothetical protein
MRPWLFILLLAAAVSAVSAANQVVLQDGQIIEGVDVRRDGDLYVITLVSGGVTTIPIVLVKEVRLDLRKPAAPQPGFIHGRTHLAGDPVEAREPAEGEHGAGLIKAGPQQLAGEPVRPVTPREATAAIGEPARFRPNIIDPTWKPESAFSDEDVLASSRSTWRDSVIDPNWRPQSAFDNRDVMAGSRSTWSNSPIDNTWVPQDGFKRKKTWWDGAGRGGAHVRMASSRTLAPYAAPVRLASADGRWYGGFSTASPQGGVQFRFRLQPRTRPAVRDCAREVLQPAESAVEITRLDDTRYSSLPFEVYRAADGVSRAVFTVNGGVCRPISGDLRDALGVRLTRSYTMDRGIEAYRNAVVSTGGPRLQTPEDKIDYAFAVVSLIDPDVSGGQGGSLVLLEDPEELEMIVARQSEACDAPAGKRKKMARKASRRVVSPRVVAVDGGGERVDLFTWSDIDGEVLRHSVMLEPSGQVSIERKEIAVHLGDHTDRD